LAEDARQLQGLTDSCSTFTDIYGNFLQSQICTGHIAKVPLEYTQALSCLIKKVFQQDIECPPLPSLSSLTAPPSGGDDGASSGGDASRDLQEVIAGQVNHFHN